MNGKLISDKAQQIAIEWNGMRAVYRSRVKRWFAIKYPLLLLPSLAWAILIIYLFIEPLRDKIEVSGGSIYSVYILFGVVSLLSPLVMAHIELGSIKPLYKDAEHRVNTGNCLHQNCS